MNFLKLCKDYNIETLSKNKDEWVNIDCPYCDTEKGHYNLGLNCNGNYYHCWKSLHNYPLTKVLSDVLSISQNEVRGILKDYEGGANIIKKEKFSKVKYLELPTDTFSKVERKYLKSRDFDPKYLHKKYNIVGGGIDGPWKFRIIIPVYYQGKLMSWTGRSILSKEKLKELGIPRYKNLSIEKSVKNIKELFFNIDNCKSDTVVLTEGSFDVLRFDGNAICSMGTELTEGQINLLANRFRKIFILFDNELPAQEKARKFGLQLSAIGLDVEVVNAYEDFGKNDMGECTREEIEIIKRELQIN